MSETLKKITEDVLGQSFTSLMDELDAVTREHPCKGRYRDRRLTRGYPSATVNVQHPFPISIRLCYLPFTNAADTNASVIRITHVIFIFASRAPLHLSLNPPSS
jgi:hypothetical protein